MPVVPLAAAMAPADAVGAPRAAHLGSVPRTVSFAPFTPVRPSERTLLARLPGSTPDLFVPAGSSPLGTPAAAVPSAILAPIRAVAPGKSPPHRGHSRPQRTVDPPPTGGTGWQHGPMAPLGPAGPESFAAVASGSSGGAASALLYAVLVGFLICAVRPLTRHVFAPAGFAPTTFVSLLQRPG